jgi:arginine-tRNA-protein transferase
MNMDAVPLHQVRLFMTTEYPCSYLPGQLARNLVADPAIVSQNIYSELASLGFRRSGDHVYRPHCESCQACLSLRIPVADFSPNRSQKRIEHKNRDLSTHWYPAEFHAEHYRLFEKYVRTRHPQGGMDDTSPENYISFVTAYWSDTWLCEFRLQQNLLAVSVVDQLNDGLSAVYTFFDPQESRRGLGTYAIQRLISEACAKKLQWVYLGYWIDACTKMAYKSNFRPHQVFQHGRWRDPV